jgi:hypothetical protein
VFKRTGKKRSIRFPRIAKQPRSIRRFQYAA